MRITRSRGLIAGAAVVVAAAAVSVPGFGWADTSSGRREFGFAGGGPVVQAGLPSQQQWLADVTAVTDDAQRYLATRLPDRRIRAAIVLDIDNTAMQTEYQSRAATPSVLALANQAEEAGAAVFFVTARPEFIQAFTASGLRSAGYNPTGIVSTGSLNSAGTGQAKTNARISIEEAGFTIVANVGNNVGDVTGGHAEQTFKLPDYDGQLS